jgi:hypothetical protein
MRTSSIVGLAVLALTFAPGTAHAQSSGNFSATGTDATCAIGAGGTFSGGAQGRRQLIYRKSVDGQRERHHSGYPTRASNRALHPNKH